MIRRHWLVLLTIGLFSGLSMAEEVTQTLETPDKVAQDIVETFGDAAKATGKLLADPLNY